MTWSIRWKLTLGTLVAVACGLLIAGVMTVQALEQQYLAQFADALEAKTKLVEYGFQPLFHSSFSPPTPSSLQETARDLGNRSSARVTLVAADGTVLADSAVRDADVPAVENHTSQPEIQQAFSTGQGEDIRPRHTTGERTMYRAVLLRQPQEAAAIAVRVGLPMAIVDREIAELKRHLLLALGVAFLVALPLSVWLAHNITRPLSDIASAARRLSSGHQTMPIRTTAQDEVGLLATTLNDMAGQLHAKIDELSEDRAQLLAVLTSMVEGVMVLDSRGHVLQINPALERMFGISRVEARGRPCAELFRHQQLNDLVTTILRSRVPGEDEIVLPLTGRCLQIEASPAGGEREREACIVLVFHDITELRRLEKIRKDFVANVSHELRTPLTSIKGYVEALLDGAKDDPVTSVKFLEIILKQSDRLNLIIEDLLELSKIESGRVSLKEEPLELRSAVDRTLSMIKPIADKKRHRLVTSVDLSLPPVAGDEGRLVQVLTNLLDNAIKYTPEGGTITVGAKLAPPIGNAEPAARAIDLSVADTGIGIPEEDRPRVFERFYRVDKARSRELGGTGLGLAIVKHIVEGHGGQVWVEANHPQGSRFVVRLPVSGGKRVSTQLSETSKV
ncbi:MAG: cell wall metabolism sensor histidine kinase WalK [Nitrospira sp.]|nr:cell wall metabolism sensor histidine kinase WalK [Nitrospira sp.]MDH4249621.1 cell wall metabolism sensor histidine kinase WalK [Nitrospira sp.]MDH4341547.1 cell wall metabolism sensor histidine kinase WalK [Nitrospira sp.]